jgi:hypothetical protein
MLGNSQSLRNGAVKRCPICNGKFGLIRHHSWQTALCSRKCVARSSARREADRKWLSPPRAA